MFKVNRKLEYALIALKHMYHKFPGELTTAKEISSDYKTPFDATSRVLQLMANHGLLKSEQGAHGGYQLQRDISKVSFLDLIEVINGSVKVANCLHNKKSECDLADSCNIVSPVTWLNKQLQEFYKKVSVYELLETPGTKCPGDTGFQQQFMV